MASPMKLSWPLLFVLAVCATGNAATQPTPAVGNSECGAPAGTATRPHADWSGRICVKLEVPQPPAIAESATVVFVWFTPEEKAKLHRGVYIPPTMLDQFLDRARVVQNVALGDRKEFAIDYPGGDAAVVAIVDRTRAFWPTMFGGGSGNLLGVGDALSGRAAVKLDAIPESGPRKEGCGGNRLELVKLNDPAVADAFGTDPDRRACVFLPASYAADASKRYPVVYLLPGFASGDTAYLSGNQDVRAKVDGAGGEVIVVSIDTGTKYGSTYFTDSASGGKWDAWMLKLVAEIDKKYRTKADAKSRALVGHSTGGFNAVSLALRHLDLFSVVGASSPDGLDFEGWLTEGGALRPKWLAWSRLEDGVGGMGQLISYAAAWSPAGEKFPWNLDTGALKEPGWSAWRAQSPARMLEDPARLARVKKELAGRIFLIVGSRDEFGLHAPTAAFDAQLTKLGVAHEFKTVDTGHETANVQHALAFAIGVLNPSTSAGK